jgi:hypothetical protein
MSKKSKKGAAFERFICPKLSLWWAGRDDVFWRSAGSGARATVRGRKGKATAGQHSDMAAIDPIGGPLIDAFTIEMKRGYPKANLHDLFDNTGRCASHPLLEWIAQVVESHNNAGSFSWMIIHRRDRRSALVYMPEVAFHIWVKASYPKRRGRLHSGTMRFPIPGRFDFLHIMTLEDLLLCVDPKLLRQQIKTL